MYESLLAKYTDICAKNPNNTYAQKDMLALYATVQELKDTSTWIF